MEKARSIARLVLIMVLIVFLLFAGLIIGVVFFGYVQSFPTKGIKQTSSVEIIYFQNRKIYKISPKQGESKNVIFYLHGGSYMGNLVKEHWNFFEDVIKDTNSTIIVPDYPLTPQYNYEDVFSFVEPLYKEARNKTEHVNFILMGDSAGGGLSLALAQKMGEQEVKQPDKIVLLSPWLDVTMSNPQIEEVQKRDPVLSVVALQAAGVAYAGDNGMGSYLVNPIKGPIQNLKNMVILTGTNDVLNPDVHVFVKRCKEEGIPVTLKETEGAEHIWMLKRHNKVYKAEEAYQSVIEEIKDVKQE